MRIWGDKIFYNDIFVTSISPSAWIIMILSATR